MKSTVDFTCRNKNYVSNRLCLCDESACVTFKKHLNCFPVSTLSHSCIFLKKLFLVGNYFGFVVAIKQQTLFSYRSFLYTWEFKKRTNKFLFWLADVKQMNFAYLLQGLQEKRFFLLSAKFDLRVVKSAESGSRCRQSRR